MTLEHSIGDPLVENPGSSDQVTPTSHFCDVELSTHGQVNYALAHNGLPFIKSLRLRPLTSTFGPLEVRISGRWAAGPIAPIKPFSKVVDITAESGNWINVDVRDCRLDDVALAELAEDSPAEIILEVHDRQTGDWQVERHELYVFSRTQWLRNRPEITAAFVQPNHPTVAQIIREASVILKSGTGSDAVDGYQALAGGDVDRPRAIAKAIFEALGAHIDHYINPPASFNEGIGQKLRPLDQILADDHGTCLDLACGYASILEQAGLNPIVFIVHGHAFTGIWTRPVTMPQASIESFATIINRYETGDIIPVETTLIPGGAGNFEAAVAEAKVHFTERLVGCPTCQKLADNSQPTSVLPHLDAAVDIRACRKERILPLPARVIQGDHVVLVIDKGGDEPPVVERRDVTTGDLLPSSVPARVQQWKNSLLDLSFRNRLLKFSPGASGLGLLTAPGLVAKVEDFVNQGQPVRILSLDGLSEVRQQAFQANLEAALGVRSVAEAVRRHGTRAVQLEMAEVLSALWEDQNAVFAFTDRGGVATKAKNLIRDARVEEQDTGVNNLHLTFGMLKWSAQGSTVGDVTSPIFLVPVKMVLKRGAVVPELVIDNDSTTTINYCLIEALKARAHLELDWFKRDIRDESGLDIEGGLRELRDEIADRGLDTQFGFEVADSLSIGLLRFNKIRLWKDLDEHWERLNSSPVVHHFISRVGESFSDPAINDESESEALTDTTLLNPQPADGAQSSAILKAISGQTFVLEGPPGTGKSQTITNLLANALAKGLKVLFVAEKQAALDVVNERLEEVGLMPFCLDLHDKGSTTRQIREQLLDALDFIPENRSTAWDSHAMDFSAVAERLDRYHQDLHEQRIGDMSYYEAYSRLIELGEGETLPIGREVVGASDELIAELRRNLVNLDTFTDAAQPRPGHPWSMATSTSFESIDRDSLARDLTTLLNHHQHLTVSESTLATLCSNALSPVDLNIALDLATMTNEGVTINEALLQQASRSGWKSELQELIQQAIDSRDALSASIGTISPEHWKLDTATLTSAVSDAATSFPIGRKKRIDAALQVLVSAPILTDRNPKNVVEKLARLTALLNASTGAVDHLTAKAGSLQIFDAEPYEPGALETARDRVHRVSGIADRAVSGDSFARSLLATLASPMLYPESDFRALSGQQAALVSIGSHLKASSDSWDAWFNGETIDAAVNRSVGMWSSGLEDGSFVTLNRWVAFLGALEALRVPGLTAARSGFLNGTFSGRGAATAFDRGLSQVVLKTIEEQAKFDIFDHYDQNRRVTQFISAMSTRQDLLTSVIPQMLHARRTFDSSSQAGRIGRFRTDLRSNRRSRGSQSIREMVERYHDLITELTPCFLMSPDSVAKFVPPGSIQFDLVVFDEASQIPVADAIGALGRATSAVIVGDSKQMPPTMVAQAAVGSGEDDVVPVHHSEEIDGDLEPAPEDAESILEECVASGIPQDMLSWHYRSRDEVLITFSNQHYYDGRLASFPSPSLSQEGCGIEYHRVDGLFDHGKTRTNVVEADAIVSDILRRVHDPVLSQFSIGVVTLNMEQRKLITQKLLDTNDDLVLDLLETEDKDRELFVLNLESVQGRERDVIIFGTAFSKRSDGSPMPLNFGPLTNPRGERRLNVAVTRARRQMVIYSSFDPSDLARANSTGMVHLRTYLTLAKQANDDAEALERAAVSDVNDPYLDEIAEAIAKRGHVVRRGYGLSSFKVDIAVARADEPELFRVGVLADGRKWGERDLVLDRDALPVNVLQNLMNWPSVVRVWLPSWRARRDEILDEIEQALAGTPITSIPDETTSFAPPSPELASDQKITRVEKPSPPVADGTPAFGLPFVATHESAQRPFSPWEQRVVGDTTHIDQLSQMFRSTVEEIVEVEGPIERDELLKKAASAFGLSRVREQRLEHLRNATPSSQTFTSAFGTFVYPKDLISDGKVNASFTWFRAGDEQRREISQIAPEELRNLCREVAVRSGGVEPAELARIALTTLGYSRASAATHESSLQKVQHLIEIGALKVENGHVIG